MQPSAARALAVANPSPRLAAVTSARRPLRPVFTPNAAAVSRPPSRPRFASRHGCPVRPNGGKHVDHGRPVRSRRWGVRDVARNDVSTPGSELPCLAADHHRDVALQDQSNLLVLVMMFRNLCVGIEIHQGQRRALTLTARATAPLTIKYGRVAERVSNW